MSLTSEQFDDLMARSFGGALDGVGTLAVGVSGGADSMALLYLLQQWCAAQGKILHALSVDHGLRDEAQDECLAVGAYCAGFGHVRHEILLYDAPMEVRVQEKARKARYALMSEYCDAQNITHLFLAHHEDDQAETVLFRLAKGSGLDGLAGIRPVQDMNGLMLCRPLLDVSKDDLVAVCHAQNIQFFNDPSNHDDAYARVRLRQSMGILEEEGMSAKRLAVTALRMARARGALEGLAQERELQYVINKNTDRIEYNLNLCHDYDEIVVRIVQGAMDEIGVEKEYAPRLEKVEALVHALKHDVAFRKRTLGGVIFERDDTQKRIVLTREKDASLR